MKVIPQWKIQDVSLQNKTQVIFEDGTILIWLHTSSLKVLEGREKGDLYQHVLSFVNHHQGEFRGSTTQFMEALTDAFPPRPLPIPVRGYGFVSEEVEGNQINYYFTHNILISYWEQTGKIVFQSEGNVENPLHEAFDAAFPHGLALLTKEEMHTVLEMFCERLPTFNKARIDANLENVKALRVDAPYKNWYPYTSVRLAAVSGEKCQEEVLDEWWNALSASERGTSLPHHLLVHAPTGLGKTPAVLAPALTWQQRLPDQRQIYYLVTTVNQHDNPIAELKRVHQVRTDLGLTTSLKVVDLVGQSQVFGLGNRTFCVAPHARPASRICTNSRQSANWKPFFPDQPVSWREIADGFKDQPICPYHFLQGLMATADVVICDYWWVFSPDASKVWGKTSQFGTKEVALIVDEAHNLIPRVRSTYDVSISQEKLRVCLEKTSNNVARIALMPLLDLLFEGGKLVERVRTKGLAPTDLVVFLDRSALEESLAFWEQQRRVVESEGEHMTEEECIVRNLLAPKEDAVVIYTRLETSSEKAQGQTELMLTMRRVDVTRDLSRGYSMVSASISVSGTLIAPGDPEHELDKLVLQFGLPPLTQTKVLKAGTPFPAENQLWVYDSQPSGVYYSRDSWLPYYAHMITNIGKATPDGVTAVFFSSYAFMRAVYNKMPIDERNLIVRENRPDNAGEDQEVTGFGSLEDYSNLLRKRVAQSDQKRAYLFALYSGKVAQGANFKENLLKTIVCVSIPAEMVELFHQQLCQRLWHLLYPSDPLPNEPLNTSYPNHKLAWKDAWVYAYERPAMYQVLQATGRGIRELNDRCAFVLLDRRYHEFKWHNFLMPAPFHTDTPYTQVETFHNGGAPKRFLDVKNTWEPKLSSIQAL